MRRAGRDGRRMLAESPTGLDLAAEAPDNLASLLGFFDRDDLPGLADLLETVARDGPDVTEPQLRELKIPVLVVGNARDLVHPLDYARRLAAMIPNSHFAEITPKAVDKARYIAELRATIGAFLKRFAISQETL
jgi:pimeloyl-ACP methyl ester carboxylesterase